MPLFQRKLPPIWYVLYPSASPSSTATPTREGPYTRAAIAHLLAAGRLSSGALLWTNERIFPNAEKPLSARPVRIPEWRRLDQLPDPVLRALEAQAAALAHEPAQQPAHAPDTLQQTQLPDMQLPHGAPPPPPAHYPAGTFTSHDDSAYPAPPAADASSPAHSNGRIPGIYPQPSAYPQTHAASGSPPPL